jgi:hypothetical protein
LAFTKEYKQDTLRTFRPGDVFYLDYEIKPNKNSNDSIVQLHGEVPFFFADVNFDGKDELLITHPRAGQKWEHAFTVHPCEEEDPFYSPFKKAPFNELDESSEIDKKNKRILTEYSGGAFHNTYNRTRSMTRHFIFQKEFRTMTVFGQLTFIK